MKRNVSEDDGLTVDTIFITTQQRDRSKYPLTNNLNVRLPRHMNEMHGIRLSSISVPRYTRTVNTHNDTLYFSEDGADDTGAATPLVESQGLYVLKIPHGNYTLDGLTQLIEESMPSALLHPAFVGTSAGVNPYNTYNWESNTAQGRVAVHTSGTLRKHYKIHCQPPCSVMDIVSVTQVNAAAHIYTLKLRCPGSTKHNLSSGTVLDLQFFEVTGTTQRPTNQTRYAQQRVDIYQDSGTWRVDADPDTLNVTLVMPAAFTSAYDFTSATLDLRGVCRPLTATNNIAPLLGFSSTVYVAAATVAASSHNATTSQDLYTGSKVTLIDTTNNSATANEYVLEHFMGEQALTGLTARVTIGGTVLASNVTVSGAVATVTAPGYLVSTANHANQSTAVLSSSSVGEEANDYVELMGFIAGDSVVNMAPVNNVFVQVRLNGLSVGNVHVYNRDTHTYETFLANIPLNGEENEIIFADGPADGIQRRLHMFEGMVSRANEIGLSLYVLYDDGNVQLYDLSNLEWSCTLECAYKY